MNEFISILIIAISLVSLMYFAYKGLSVLFIAPILAMITAFFVTDLNPLYALTEPYMSTLVVFIKDYFPVFMAGAIFGKIMAVTGASKSISIKITDIMGEKRAMLAVVIATAILTYGGVSLFVVVFAIYPLAVGLFRKSDIPKYFIAPCIAMGSITFTMTALPGSPQAINVIPIKTFGTNIYSAPVLGILATIIMFSLGMLYLNRCLAKAKARGEGYGNYTENFQQVDESKLPKFGLAIIPLLLVFIGNYFFTWLFKQESVMAYFYENSQINDLINITEENPINGIWAVTISLFISCTVAIFLFKKQIANVKKTISDGTVDSLLPIFNTASENGYGGVIKLTTGFSALQTILLSIPLFPLFKVAFATTILAGIVGSSSAGTALALSIFGDDFISLAQNYNIPFDVMHRIILLSAGCLDSLPHCGAVITLLVTTGLTHKDSYKYIAVAIIAIPSFATIVTILFYMITGIY